MCLTSVILNVFADLILLFSNSVESSSWILFFICIVYHIYLHMYLCMCVLFKFTFLRNLSVAILGGLV